MVNHVVTVIDQSVKFYFVGVEVCRWNGVARIDEHGEHTQSNLFLFFLGEEYHASHRQRAPLGRSETAENILNFAPLTFLCLLDAT